MDMTVQTGQSTTRSGTSLASLSWTSDHAEPVVLLLQVDAEPDDAKTLEKEATGIIRHALLETEGDAATRLDGTLKELNGLLKGLLLTGSIRDVHAIVAIEDTEGNLHVSHAGRAEAYIVRAGTASQITEYTKGKASPAFVYIASGATEPRDTIILSTQRLLRSVTPAQLAQMVQQRGDRVLDELLLHLESDNEMASLAVLTVKGAQKQHSLEEARPPRSTSVSRHRSRNRKTGGGRAVLEGVRDRMRSLLSSARIRDWISAGHRMASRFARDLKDPSRKRRAHLLLLAGTLACFVVVWAVLQLTVSTERSKTREELAALVEQISSEIRTADNRRLTGDMDAANAILERAEERAKQVMDNESGLYRMEALDLLDRIRAKREEINNVTRLAPRVVVNLTAKNPDISAQGFVGVADGEFVVFDKQDLYRVVLNTIESPKRLNDEELILLGAFFPRYQSLVFQTTGNAVMEVIAGQPTLMKTEDPAGWITGKSMEAYLRFLYILSPENNQIYKYERLSNRYAAPAPYNVNGDLSGALDMAIDGNVYVLKDNGTVVKLLRGETRPFVIRHAPERLLDDATRIFKVGDGSLYFLDPVHGRVIVVSDGGESGESSYLRQYVLEGDQIGRLQDLYVDPDESRAYVLDEKRIYAIDLK